MAELMDILGLDEAEDLTVAQIKEEDEATADPGADETPASPVEVAEVAPSIRGGNRANLPAPPATTVQPSRAPAWGPLMKPPGPTTSLEGIVPYPYKEWLRHQTAYGELSKCRAQSIAVRPECNHAITQSRKRIVPSNRYSPSMSMPLTHARTHTSRRRLQARERALMEFEWCVERMGARTGVRRGVCSYVCK